MSSMLLILEKINSKDKDFRYMATSDLLNELQKETFRADGDMERRLGDAILVQLEDQSGDISGMAVKCVGHLVRKVSQARAEVVIKTLCERAITALPKGKNEQQRDMAMISLKTVVGEISGGNLAVSASNMIANKMLEGLTKEASNVISDSLDILAEVTQKFGNLLVAEHARIKATLVPLLDDARAPIRKRAMHCLAAMSVYMNDGLLDEVVSHLLQRLKEGQRTIKPDVLRSYVAAVGHVSRSVGYRFGKYLVEATALVVSYCEAAKEKEGDDELREHCLQAMEGFVLCCPTDARSHMSALIDAGLKFIKFDPNFADEDMDEDGAEEGGEEDEEQEEEEEEAYSDDEDVSWKVRRAAAKLISVVASQYPDAVAEVYKRTSGELINRFREREENVKGDVFAAYIVLARQVGNVSKRYRSEDPNNPVQLLHADVPAVVRSCAKQLKEKNPKTRMAVFGLLRELIGVAPVPVAQQLPLLVPGITAALSDSAAAAASSGLKVEALQFTRLALATSGAAAPPTKDLKQLTQAVLPCASERYYKVAAESLRVCEQVILVLRPRTGGTLAAVPGDLKDLVPKLFSALRGRLAAPDQDQEVKESSITGTATAVGQLADLLAPELPSVLQVLLDRLRNEITRLTAVRAFGTIAASPLPVDLGAAGVLEPVAGELTSFLRKALRPLRQAALMTMQALAVKCGNQLQASTLASFVEEASPLVNDSDLTLASAALSSLESVVTVQPGTVSVVAGKTVPHAMTLVRSPLLQGGALEQLQGFLKALVKSSEAAGGAVSFQSLLDELLASGRMAGAVTGGKTAQQSVAVCVAVLCSTAGPQHVQSTTDLLVKEVKTKAQDTTAQRLALLCLGEIGRRADLSGIPQVESTVSESLKADSEEIKGAASLALGGVACGNLGKFMPSLIRQISSAAKSSPKQQYLLLTALSEVITTCSEQTNLLLSQDDQAQVLSLLLGSAEGEEECRTVVAECLGRLSLLSPEKVLAELRQRISNPSPNMRAVAVSAIKSMVVERPHPVDAPLASCVVELLLAALADADRHVRRAAVVSLSAVVHGKPGLVASGGALGRLLPLLYAQTVIRADMVRTVDLGPFKHKIDDGLELRKAAFECLDILLDSPECRSQLEVPTFLAHLKSGLADHADVKAPSHLMVVKLCALDPAAVLGGVEGLVEPLEKTLLTRLKSDAVKQEVDRHEDMLRSCLRAVDALAHLPGIQACGPFQAFMRRVVLISPILERYKQVEKERAEAEGPVRVDAMDTS
uniref:TATA-binding protein interacting (TIP20) domain-containing protein n=1 Tax=Dunaliella tertiolecta TaxID=3047 RepID=A0A7S3QNX2_DUNTE